MEILWNLSSKPVATFILPSRTKCCNSWYLWDQTAQDTAATFEHITEYLNWPPIWSNLSAHTHLGLPKEAIHCNTRTVFAQCFWVGTWIKLFYINTPLLGSSEALWEGDKPPNWMMRSYSYSGFSISFSAHGLPWGKSQCKGSMLCVMLLCIRFLGAFSCLPA